MAGAIADIIDKSIPESQRLAMIDDIVDGKMAGVESVLTVASDLETAVDHETVPQFLRRICLSPFIKNVVIISNASDENKHILTVHEIRTK